MADLKCGQQGYKGPKCKVKDYDLCDELQAGAKLTEFFPGKSKKYQQNKLNYINKQTRKDSFWLVNNEAKGLCWDGGWYLYQFPKVNGNGKSHPVAKEKDFFEKAEDLFDDTIKGYQRKVEQIKKEGANLENVVGNFWKEMTGVLGAIALITTIKIIRSVKKKKKKKAEAAAQKDRVSERVRAEPQTQSRLSDHRFADNMPLPLTKEMRTPVSTSTPKPVPASVAQTEEVLDLTRPSSESSVSKSQPSQPPASKPSGNERPTVEVDYSSPGGEAPSGARPTVEVRGESSHGPIQVQSP